MLRAASQFTMRVDGKLLAAKPAAGERAPSARQVSNLDALAARGAAAGSAFELSVMPGSRLQLLVLHPAGSPPPISVCMQPMAYPQACVGTNVAEASDTASEWEFVDASPLPGVAKLAQPLTQQALRHLPLLEPAFCEPAGLCLPVETSAERSAVCLKISLAGQIVAPSVTKGCAVAQLQTNLQPVPEHCR